MKYFGKLTWGLGTCVECGFCCHPYLLLGSPFPATLNKANGTNACKYVPKGALWGAVVSFVIFEAYHSANLDSWLPKGCCEAPAGILIFREQLRSDGWGSSARGALTWVIIERPLEAQQPFQPPSFPRRPPPSLLQGLPSVSWQPIVLRRQGWILCLSDKTNETVFKKVWNSFFLKNGKLCQAQLAMVFPMEGSSWENPGGGRTDMEERNNGQMSWICTANF